MPLMTTTYVANTIVHSTTTFPATTTATAILTTLANVTNHTNHSILPAANETLIESGIFMTDMACIILSCSVVISMAICVGILWVCNDEMLESSVDATKDAFLDASEGCTMCMSQCRGCLVVCLKGARTNGMRYIRVEKAEACTIETQTTGNFDS